MHKFNWIYITSSTHFIDRIELYDVWCQVHWPNPLPRRAYSAGLLRFFFIIRTCRMDAMHANGVFSPNTITVLDNNSFVCVFSVCVFFFFWLFKSFRKGECRLCSVCWWNREIDWFSNWNFFYSWTKRKRFDKLINRWFAYNIFFMFENQKCKLVSLVFRGWWFFGEIWMRWGDIAPKNPFDITV